ncbi:MAG: tetratricopeptide repeat protein [Halieaceae bacterium]|nr:tetratricopeptide repeat protein [Halieaceae bacterium]
MALQSGDWQKATRLYQKILTIEADHVTALINLGTLAYRQGDLVRATEYFQRANTHAPESFHVQNNLAISLHALGQLPEAISHYQQASQIQPGNAQVHADLGRAHYENGDYGRAKACYQKSLQINPNLAEAHNNLGVIYKFEQDGATALKHYRQAVEIQPENYVARRNTAIILEEQYDIEAARTAYRGALALKDDPFTRLHSELLVPPIAASNAAIDAYREKAGAILDRYMGMEVQINLGQLQASRYEPPLAWGYQGRVDRPLKEKFARIFEAALPYRDGQPPPGSGKSPPHIGFVVTPGHAKVFMRCMRGILNHLPGERFRLTVVCDPSTEPILRSGITNPAVRYLRWPAPPRFDQLLKTIWEARFDLLYHWETGTDSTNYFTPFYRLAPVQCTGWGWPDTSAAPEMDYYLTAEALATPGSDAHHTETLVRLPNLPTYFYPPPIPAAPPDRAHFGLPERANLYLCGQNLRKIHPDFDPILNRILDGDPKGRLVLVADKVPRVTELLQERWQNTLAEVLDRVHFLPYMDAEDYFGLLSLADVALDTLYYGGAITTYDTLAAGTPMVTTPGLFLRGRYAYAAYQSLGIEDCISDSPESYVEKALQLGTDAAYRDEIGTQIKDAVSILYENQAAVQELAEFFDKAIAEAGGPL